MTTDATFPGTPEQKNNQNNGDMTSTLASRLYRDSVSRMRPQQNARTAMNTEHLSVLDQTEKTITSLVNRQSVERDGWWRKMSATLALLRQANAMIDKAEAKIRAQQERISVLEDLATADDLTGLKNRRGFIESFARELDMCDRSKSRGGLLVMIDLDNFKSINDTFGHQAGDACLRLVGRTLQTEIRAMDTAARLGGDEFILLMSNTCRNEATARAQMIAARLNNLSLAWYGDIIPIRASVGLKNFGAGDSLESVIRDADARMYQTKATRQRKTDYPVHTTINEPVNA